MRFHHLLAAALLFASPIAAFAANDAQPFLTGKQVELARLLPPPPAAGSDKDKAEMAEVVTLDHTRTPERAAQATADSKEDVFAMYGSVMGPKFTAATMPNVAAFFARLNKTEDVITEDAKNAFARPRPYVANSDLKPVAPKSKSFSYPSGHATSSAMIGIVLANMVPERKAAIFARMDDYAESRVIAGVHYRTDIVAGRQSGVAVDAVLFDDKTFLAAYTPIRAELRKALGLAE